MKILFFLFLILSLSVANENNVSSSAKRTWHYGLSGGFGVINDNLVEWSVALYGEKLLAENHAILLRGMTDKTKYTTGNARGYGVDVSYIYYFDKDAYFYKGLYARTGFEVYEQTSQTSFEYVDYITYAGIGYGWHFLGDYLLVTLGTYVKYTYETRDEQTIYSVHYPAGSGDSFEFEPIKLGLALVF